MPTLSLTPATETDLAGRLLVFRWASETDTAEALAIRTTRPGIVAETDTALAFTYEDEPWRRPKVHKLARGIAPIEVDEAQTFVITHVMNRTLTPVTEADAAQAVTKSTGAKIRKTLVPVTESG